jgi:hypothetical protein
MAQIDRPDVDAQEREALHELQLGIEHIHRAYGHLLAFHHQTGRAMDRFAAAEALLDKADHGELSETIHQEILPAGVIDDRWSYELVEAFEQGFLMTVRRFEQRARKTLADGVSHVAERRQQREWRERARR